MPDPLVPLACFVLLALTCTISIVTGLMLYLVAHRIAETLAAIHAQLVSQSPRDASP